MYVCMSVDIFTEYRLYTLLLTVSWNVKMKRAFTWHYTNMSPKHTKKVFIKLNKRSEKRILCNFVQSSPHYEASIISVIAFFNACYN